MVGVVHFVAFNISASGIHLTDATITWNTNGISDSTVEYGPTAGYGATATDPTPVADHAIPLDGLSTGTVYHYRVTSVDSLGNLYTSPDQQFTTGSVAPVVVIGGGGGGGMGGGNGGSGESGTSSGTGTESGVGTGVGTGVSTGTAASPGSPSGPSSPEAPKESKIPLSVGPTPIPPTPTATPMGLPPATMAIGFLAAVGLFSRRRR
ncbi:MAG TPA: fibronectin type III domain-containing protein [Methanomicrobiales archaeon]|nr:fibronectin type III domain-containing protein [Methanomicrobiales archaeon]